MLNRIEPLPRNLPLRAGDAFIRRMSQLAPLTEADIAALALVSSGSHTVPAHTDIVQQEGAPERAGPPHNPAGCPPLPIPLPERRRTTDPLLSASWRPVRSRLRPAGTNG